MFCQPPYPQCDLSVNTSYGTWHFLNVRMLFPLLFLVYNKRMALMRCHRFRHQQQTHELRAPFQLVCVLRPQIGCTYGGRPTTAFLRVCAIFLHHLTPFVTEKPLRKIYFFPSTFFFFLGQFFLLLQRT